jgi:hypothetical protein
MRTGFLDGQGRLAWLTLSAVLLLLALTLPLLSPAVRCVLLLALLFPVRASLLFAVVILVLVVLSIWHCFTPLPLLGGLYNPFQ